MTTPTPKTIRLFGVFIPIPLWVQTRLARPDYPWQSVIALTVILFLLLFNIQSKIVWGLFFAAWFVPTLLTGVTYLMDEIDKRHYPVLYWLVTALWLFFAYIALFFHG